MSEVCHDMTSSQRHAQYVSPPTSSTYDHHEKATALL